jgi:hypothetical protein
MVLPSTSDGGLFDFMTLRQGGLRLASDANKNPRVFNIGVLIDSEGPDMPDLPVPRMVQSGDWDRGMDQCGGMKVSFGTLEAAASSSAVYTGYVPPGKYPFAPGLLKDAAGNPFTASHTFTSDDTKFVQAKCQEDKFNKLSLTLFTILEKYETVESMNNLRSLQKTVQSFLNHPDLRTCNKLMDSLVTKAQATIPAGVTSNCMIHEYEEDSEDGEGSEDGEDSGGGEGESSTRSSAWLADCRCNRALQHTQCCVPVESTREGMTLSGVNTDTINVQCDNPLVVQNLLYDSVVSGSTETMMTEDDLWQMAEPIEREQRAFLEDCEAAMHSTTCSSSTDCKYGTTCDTHSGRCQLQGAGVRMPAYFQCYAHSMGTVQKRQFYEQLGVASDCDFFKCPTGLPDCLEGQKVANTSMPCYVSLLAAFETEMTVSECVGHESHHYRSRHEWGLNGDGEYEGILVPANQSGCLREQFCLGDTQWPRTTFTAEDDATCEDDGVNGCFQCYGGGSDGDCWEVSVYSVCEVLAWSAGLGSNQTLCEELGSRGSCTVTATTCAPTRRPRARVRARPRSWTPLRARSRAGPGRLMAVRRRIAVTPTLAPRLPTIVLAKPRVATTSTTAGTARPTWTSTPSAPLASCSSLATSGGKAGTRPRRRARTAAATGICLIWARPRPSARHAQRARSRARSAARTTIATVMSRRP